MAKETKSRNIYLLNNNYIDIDISKFVYGMVAESPANSSCDEWFINTSRPKLASNC